MLLTLLSMQFMGLFYQLLIITVFCLLYFDKKIRLYDISNITFCLLSIFTILYILFNIEKHLTLYYLYWITSFFLGSILISNKRIDKFYSYLTCISLGSALHGVISIVNIYINLNTLVFDSRFLPSVWENEPMGATSQSILFLLFSGTFFSITFLNSYKIRILYAIIFTFTLLNAFASMSRTALVYPLLTIIISIIYYTYKIKQTKYLKIILFVTILFNLFYMTDLFGFQSFLNEQQLIIRINENEDGGILQNSRLGSWAIFFNNFEDYVFGGLNSINNIEYMHNIVLDTFAFAGLIPFVLIIILLIRFIRSIFKILKFENPLNCSFLVGYSVSFLLIFNSEPIIQASNWFFCLFLIFFGMITKYLYLAKKSIYEN